MGEGLVEASEIGTTFVPRFRADVATVEVGDEAVLFEEDTGNLHQLDPIATIVCGFFDGQTSIADVVTDLAEGFDAPRETIETDVLAMIRRLGRLGLFVGVSGVTIPEEPMVDC